MSGEDYPVEVEITVEMDDGEPVVCIDLDGELHVFSVPQVVRFRAMLDRNIEYAVSIAEYGPDCEFDA